MDLDAPWRALEDRRGLEGDGLQQLDIVRLLGGRRASTVGEVSSIRRPTREAMRSMI
jgi:hypothetical protein